MSDVITKSGTLFATVDKDPIHVGRVLLHLYPSAAINISGEDARTLGQTILDTAADSLVDEAGW